LLGVTRVAAAESMRCTILVQVGSALLALSSFLCILLELNDLLLPPETAVARRRAVLLAVIDAILVVNVGRDRHRLTINSV